MSNRISYSHSGLRGINESHLPAYATLTEADDNRLAAVRRAIARKSGYSVLTCCPDGRSPESDHYQLTLGRRVSSGGSSVEGSLWISIPIE